MAVNFSVGNKIDIKLPNATVEQINDDQSACLVILPDDGSGQKYEFWIPTTDPRVEINLIAPANWPPRENDVWIVPGITTPAFVVANESGTVFFLTADAIRTAYNSGATVLPPTIDDALTAFGNQLELLYRPPAQ